MTIFPKFHIRENVFQRPNNRNKAKKDHISEDHITGTECKYKLKTESSFFSFSATSFWWSKMKRYMAKEKDVEDWREAFESGKFPLYFSDFLFHKDGAQEREKSFKFDGELECGEAAPRIKVQMA